VTWTWRGLLISLMMEAARSSETLLNFYQTTRRYNPEDSHLRTHRLRTLNITIDAIVDFPILNVNARDLNEAPVARNLKYQ
jgi:hypothetical protein